MLNKYPKLIEFIEEYRNDILESKSNTATSGSFISYRDWNMKINSIHKRLNNYTKDDFIVLHELDEKDYHSRLTIRFPFYKEAFTINATLNYDGNKLAFINSIKEGSYIKYEDYLSGSVRPGTSGKITHIFTICQTDGNTVESVIGEAIKLAKHHFKKLLETKLKVKVYPNTTKVKAIELTEKNLPSIEKELDKMQEGLVTVVTAREIKNNNRFSINGSIKKDYKLLENLQYVESIMLKKVLEAELDKEGIATPLKTRLIKV